MKTINKKVVGYLELKSINLTTPSNNQIWAYGNHLYVRLNGVTYQLDQQSGTGGGHVIQDNGSDKTQRTKLNFKNFTVTDNLANDSTDIEFDTSWIVIPTKTSDITNDSGFITSSALSGYELLSNKSTSTSLGTSDSLYPTQNAVKQYVDTGLSGKQNSLGFTPEDVVNKATTVTGNESSNTKYGTIKAIYDWAVGLFTPQSRTITINGDTKDLSANRSWSISGGVSSLNALTGALSITAGDGIDVNVSGSDIEITNTGSGINIDGGVSNSTYGTLTPIDGGVA